MVHGFKLFRPNLYPNIWMSQQKLRLRQRFSNPLLSSFGEPVWIVSSCSCSQLTGMTAVCFFCCCCLSPSSFNELCVQTCSSADLSCSKWLFELLLPFCQLKSVWPFTSDLIKAFSPTELPLTGFFILFCPFSVNPKQVVCENPSRSAVSEILRPARLAPTTILSSKSLFFLILMLSLNFSKSYWSCLHA